MEIDRDDITSCKHCPTCNTLSVIFDFLQGIHVCEECGRVLQGEDLVHSIFTGDDTNTTTGIFVGARDSGLQASLRNINDPLLAQAIQRTRPHEASKKFLDSLKIIADQLQLPSEAYQQAIAHLERLVPIAAGAWKRELLAAAAAYTAIRLNSLPLSLLDLSVATRIDVYTLGSCYRYAVAMLGVRPPRVRPQVLLPRCLHKVLLGKTTPSKSTVSVREDGLTVLDWMDRHDIGTSYPLSAVAAAIILALDMNSIHVSVQHVISVLDVSMDAVKPKLLATKSKLLSYSSLLPYVKEMTMKNVGTYARSIIKLSNILDMGNMNSNNGDKNDNTSKRGVDGVSCGGNEGLEVAGVLQFTQNEEGSDLINNKTGSKWGNSKKRKKVTFQHAVQEIEREGGKHHGEEQGEEEEDLKDAIPDDGFDEYLRSSEEVEALKKLYDAIS